MPKLQPLSLKVTINGDSFEFSGMDFVQLAIDVMQEIEEEILAQGDALKPEGDGSEESPYVLKSNEQWLYAALEIIKPDEKKESYWRIGNRIIKCHEEDRYMIDRGNLNKALSETNNLLKAIGCEETDENRVLITDIIDFFRKIDPSSSLHPTEDDIKDGSIYHKNLRLAYLFAILSVFILVALAQNASDEKKERLRNGAEALLKNLNDGREHFSKHIGAVGKNTGPSYPEIYHPIKRMREFYRDYKELCDDDPDKLIANHILNLIASNGARPLSDKIHLSEDFIPVTTASFFLSEVGRNPVSFLINKILFSMIASESQGSHFLKDLNIGTTIWCDETQRYWNMYGDEHRIFLNYKGEFEYKKPHPDDEPEDPYKVLGTTCTEACDQTSEHIDDPRIKHILSNILCLDKEFIRSLTLEKRSEVNKVFADYKVAVFKLYDQAQRELIRNLSSNDARDSFRKKTNITNIGSILLKNLKDSLEKEENKNIKIAIADRRKDILEKYSALQEATFEDFADIFQIDAKEICKLIGGQSYHLRNILLNILINEFFKERIHSVSTPDNRLAAIVKENEKMRVALTDYKINTLQDDDAAKKKLVADFSNILSDEEGARKLVEKITGTENIEYALRDPYIIGTEFFGEILSNSFRQDRELINSLLEEKNTMRKTATNNRKTGSKNQTRNKLKQELADYLKEKFPNKELYKNICKLVFTTISDELPYSLSDDEYNVINEILKKYKEAIEKIYHTEQQKLFENLAKIDGILSHYINTIKDRANETGHRSHSAILQSFAHIHKIPLNIFWRTRGNELQLFPCCMECVSPETPGNINFLHVVTEDDRIFFEILEYSRPLKRDWATNPLAIEKIGGLGAMQHDGSFKDEFEGNCYRFDQPFSTARQKESLILTEWLYVVLQKKYTVTIESKDFLDGFKWFKLFDSENLQNNEGDLDYNERKRLFLENEIKPMMRDMILSPQLDSSLKNDASQPDVLSPITMNWLFSSPRTSNSGNQNSAQLPSLPANKK